jgi:hypothetical protein
VAAATAIITYLFTLLLPIAMVAVALCSRAKTWNTDSDTPFVIFALMFLVYALPSGLGLWAGFNVLRGSRRAQWVTFLTMAIWTSVGITEAVLSIMHQPSVPTLLVGPYDFEVSLSVWMLVCLAIQIHALIHQDDADESLAGHSHGLHKGWRWAGIVVILCVVASVAINIGAAMHRDATPSAQSPLK